MSQTRCYYTIHRFSYFLLAMLTCFLLGMQTSNAGNGKNVWDAPQISITPLDNTNSTADRTLQANIAAGTGVSAAFLHYRVDGGTWFTTAGTPSGSTYTFTLAGQPAGTLVEYYVLAYSGADSSTSPANVHQHSVYGSFYEYSILCSAGNNRQLAFQGFENGPLANRWNFTSSCVTGCTGFSDHSKVSNDNPATDIPASSRIRTGSYSYQHQSNGDITASLVFDHVAIPHGATNIKITVRVASIAAANGGGADADDYVKAFVALGNSNFPGNADITLTGHNNIRYGYDATGIVTTDAGTPVTYSPANGNDQPVNGRSTLVINIPDNAQAAALKLEIMNNDNSNREVWAIDDIELTADIPSTGRYFKSIKNGAWDAPFTWAVSNTANGDYTPSCSIPNYLNSDGIQISAGDTVIINKDLTDANAIDQLAINANGVLRLENNRVEVLNSGNGKADLLVEGMFHDRSNDQSIQFINGASWQMLDGGTYKKCGGANVGVWRDHYANGMETIPASGYWEYCFDGIDEVNILTENMVYPNLSFLNMSGNNLHVFPAMNGSASPAKIKGDLKIGDRLQGSDPVKVWLNNTSAELLLVEGNILVDSASVFTNVSYDGMHGTDHGYGTGIELKGHLTAVGSFNMSGDTAHIGMLKITGTAAQDITGNNNILLEDMAIDNRTGGRVLVNNDIDIFGTLSFASNQSKLQFGTGDIHLKSTAARTANVGIVPNGVLINYQDTGRFVVERYIATTRKWQLLSVPVNSTGTVKENWQENGLPADSIPGYGVNITGPTAPEGGLDHYSANYSLKKYIPGDDINAEGTYDPVRRPDSALLENPFGYFLYVYGDRSVTAGGDAGPATVLRSRGKLFVGNDVVNDQPTVGNGNQDRYMSIGNPFASAIDFTELKLHSSIDDEFYLWDPKMEGDYTAGAFVAFSASTNPPYMPVPWLGIPPQPSNTPSPSFPEPNTRIESGQAFFVYKSGNGNGFVKFEERDKIDGSRDVNRTGRETERPPRPITSRAQFNISLLALSHAGGYRLLDGNAVVWGNEFRSGQQNGDMRKLWNQSDNFAIAGNDGKELVIDTRPAFNDYDTVKLLMYGQFYEQYQFKFSQTNMQPNTKAWIVDRYLGTQTSIDLRDTSTYNFSVDGNAASTAQDRFYVLFAKNNRPVAQQDIAVVEAISATAFPNPATGSGFAVRVNTAASNERYNLQLINSDGKLIYTTQFITTQQSTVVNVRPAAALQAGYYKVLISNGKNTVTLSQLVVD